MPIIKRYEQDAIVGTGNVYELRQYHIATVDTLSHAVRISDQHETAFVEQFETMADTYKRIVPGQGTEYFATVVNKGHPHGYGNVVRKTWFRITL